MKTHFENLAEAMEEIRNLRIELAVTGIEKSNAETQAAHWESVVRREREQRAKHERTIHAQRQLCSARSKERDVAQRKCRAAEDALRTHEYCVSGLQARVSAQEARHQAAAAKLMKWAAALEADLKIAEEKLRFATAKPGEAVETTGYLYLTPQEACGIRADWAAMRFDQTVGQPGPEKP